MAMSIHTRAILPDLGAEIYTYDAETYPNYALMGFLNTTTFEVHQFEISHRRNQAAEMKAWLNERAATSVMFGFNNFGYDDLMLTALLDGETDNSVLHALSTAIVEGDSYYGLSYKSILAGRDGVPMLCDLMTMLKDRASLKELGIKLDHPILRELPFDPHLPVTEQQMDFLGEYNVNDLMITRALLLNLENALAARFALAAKYGINTISMPDKKLGETILARLYAAKDYTRRDEWKEPVSKLLHPLIAFAADEFNGVLDRMNKWGLSFILKTEDVVDEKGEVTQEKSILTNPFSDQICYGGLTLQYGMGGLHSLDEPGIVEADDDNELCDIDAASYYPMLMMIMRLHPEHLDTQRFTSAFNRIIQDRLAAKDLAARAKKAGDAVVERSAGAAAQGLKVAINSVYGKSKSPYSWLLDPIVGAQVCLNGQLILSMVMEMATAVGYEVLSVNTDGILVRGPRTRSGEIRQIVADLGNAFGLTFEFTSYAKYIRRDVNNYMALTVDGKTKSKGVYAAMSDGVARDLSKKEIKRIVPKAVAAHFFHNTPVGETIRACRDIREFLDYFKCSPGWSALTDDGTTLPRINRWYEGTTGQMLWKTKNGGADRQKFSNVSRAVLVNDLPPDDAFPTDLDYAHYEEAALALIEPIEHPAVRSQNLAKFAELKPKQQALIRAAQTTDSINFNAVMYADDAKQREDYRAKYRGDAYSSMRTALVSLWINERGRLTKGDLLYIALGWDEPEGNFKNKRKQKELEKLVDWVVRTIVPFEKPKKHALTHTTLFDSTLVKTDWLTELCANAGQDAKLAFSSKIVERAAKHEFEMSDEFLAGIMADVERTFQVRS